MCPPSFSSSMPSHAQVFENESGLSARPTSVPGTPSARQASKGARQTHWDPAAMSIWRGGCTLSSSTPSFARLHTPDEAREASADADIAVSDGVSPTVQRRQNGTWSARGMRQSSRRFFLAPYLPFLELKVDCQKHRPPVSAKLHQSGPARQGRMDCVREAISQANTVRKVKGWNRVPASRG